MPSLVLSTLGLGLRWGVWWLRPRATRWLIALVLYGLMSRRKIRA